MSTDPIIETFTENLPGEGFFLRSKVLKNRTGESWRQNHLADQQLYQLLEKVDTDLTEQARSKGCLLCGGKLHRSDSDPKPRGGPQWDLRSERSSPKAVVAGEIPAGAPAFAR